ncbi:hypothetical protein BASA62_003436 [Batrachochytrium salamandrivorans]|nr:hypothetical protein BASA62_003436 [Batrachochytrium salamandrivorans]
MSNPQFEHATPVTPPNVNSTRNPLTNLIGARLLIDPPHIVANHEKILIPVGTPIIIVAAVKYARVSQSLPTVYMWCAHTRNPILPIDTIAYTIPLYPNVAFRAYTVTTCDTIPNPGLIRIYTSGCPKNQNKCWYSTGSPPPAGSKNVVFIFRSVSSIVIAPANTGSDLSSNTAVILTAHTNSGIRCNVLPNPRMFLIVVIKFTAPKIDDVPAKCNAKIALSTAGPLCASTDDSGGYTVHPVPAPASTLIELTSLLLDGGISQNEMLFNRGNAISGAPTLLGTNQFPNPPIISGITK